MSEVGGQRTGKDGGRRTEGEKTDVRSQGSEVGGRKDRCQKSEVRGRERTEDGGHPGEIGKKKAFHWVKKSGQGKEFEGQKSWPRFHSTFDIIAAAEKGLLPDRIMINTHPQRWTDKPLPWVKELLWQNFKNVGKRIIVSRPVKQLQRRFHKAGKYAPVRSSGPTPEEWTSYSTPME